MRFCSGNNSLWGYGAMFGVVLSEDTPSECCYIIVPIRYGQISLGDYGAMYDFYTGMVLWNFRISSKRREAIL